MLSAWTDRQSRCQPDRHSVGLTLVNAIQPGLVDGQPARDQIGLVAVPVTWLKSSCA